LRADGHPANTIEVTIPIRICSREKCTKMHGQRGKGIFICLSAGELDIIAKWHDSGWPSSRGSRSMSHRDSLPSRSDFCAPLRSARAESRRLESCADGYAGCGRRALPASLGFLAVRGRRTLVSTTVCEEDVLEFEGVAERSSCGRHPGFAGNNIAYQIKHVIAKRNMYKAETFPSS
jgi:hypothetical protein